MLSYALAGHAAVLAGSIAAYYKYGDRTEVLDRSLRGIEAVLMELKRRIAFRLGMVLKPVFDKPPQLISMQKAFGATFVEDKRLVGPDGNPLPEIIVSPVGSEDYNNALHAFIQSDFSDIVDFRRLIEARDAWCLWARCLSRAIYVLMVIECASFAGFAAVGKLAEVPVPKWAIGGSFALTASILAACLLPLACMLRQHDRIMVLRMRHAAP